MSWIVCCEKNNEITWTFKSKNFSRILLRLELVEFWILGNCKDLNLVIFSVKLPNLNVFYILKDFLFLPRYQIASSDTETYNLLSAQPPH